jgi:threonine dehydrogenase-like Zn-dependent dehydrogenase
MLPTVETNVVEIAGPREIRFEQETLVLEGMGPREIAAETLYTAVSPGSEMAAYEGLQVLRPDRKHSRAVGYCNLARVIGCGEYVRRYRPGDLILTLESHRSHFVCNEEEVLLKLPDGDYTEEQLQAAATTYLFHQGYAAVLAGDLKPGQYVAVVGLGTLGLATVAVASRFGARVFGLSDQPESREAGCRAGAREVFGKSQQEAALEAFRRGTAATGIDLVVLTGSSWEDYRLAVEIARPGGRVCILGFPGRREAEIPFNPLDPRWFYRKQLAIIACGYTPDVDIAPRDIRFTIRRNCAYLMELILSGELPAAELVSTVVPWHEVGDVYARIAAREPAFRTAVLRWAGEEGGP